MSIIQNVPEIKEYELRQAIFAAGCFWGVEYIFSKVDGVVSVVSGYTGGHRSEPVYEDVCSGWTGHAEAVLIVYNPSIVTYEELVRLFFKMHNPTTLNRQGPDSGEQYRSEIFYKTDKEREIAQSIKDQFDSMNSFDKHSVTTITRAGIFYRAEEYHQRYYYKKNKTPYCHFLRNSF